jgi:short-subunit dehydrogenase
VAKQARSLRGKIVVITGGARGIGAATTRALVAKGARVAIGDLDEDVTTRAAKELGPDVLGLRLDVTTSRQLAINLAAVIHGTRQAMKRMKPRRTGHIVNVASLAGKAGMAGGATYCATKHGVVGLSEAVQQELRGTGVEVSCVMPTIVNTELAAGVKSSKLSSSVEPEDVADAIVAALEYPRHEVYVPANLGPTTKWIRVLPRRVGEWIAVKSGTDTLLSDAAHSHARDAYEARAAASAPASDQSA